LWQQQRQTNGLRSAPRREKQRGKRLTDGEFSRQLDKLSTVTGSARKVLGANLVMPKKNALETNFFEFPAKHPANGK